MTLEQKYRALLAAVDCDILEMSDIHGKWDRFRTPTGWEGVGHTTVKAWERRGWIERTGERSYGIIVRGEDLRRVGGGCL